MFNEGSTTNPVDARWRLACTAWRVAPALENDSVITPIVLLSLYVGPFFKRWASGKRTMIAGKALGGYNGHKGEQAGYHVSNILLYSAK